MALNFIPMQWWWKKSSSLSSSVEPWGCFHVKPYFPDTEMYTGDSVSPLTRSILLCIHVFLLFHPALTTAALGLHPWNNSRRTNLAFSTQVLIPDTLLHSDLNDSVNMGQKSLFSEA
jgi:hypothetical protein